MSPLVLITGASSGIGQALAQRFYGSGYRIALWARRTKAMQQWVEGQGWDMGRIGVYCADVTDVESVVTAARQCLASQGLPEIVIASAGISLGMDTRERSDLDVMQRTFATNTIGMAATFHPFMQAMCERGSGVLVGVGSVAGIRGLPGHGAYCASKAAVIAYCESLRGELRGTGVHVVTLCPGYVDTPLTRQNRYSMPFLMPVERFADRAFAAIKARHSYCVIPWQMGWVAKLLRALPNPVFDRLLAGRPRKHRADQA